MGRGSGGTRRSNGTAHSEHNFSVNKMTQSGYDSYGGGKEGKTIQGYIAKGKGFAGKPALVSSSEFEKLKKDDNYIVMYRGFRKDEDKNIRDFKTGDYYSGHGGAGEGIYFSPKPLTGFSQTGRFVEGSLDKRKAKIGEYSTLYPQWQKERASHLQKYSFTEYYKLKTDKERADFAFRYKAYDDFGRWATMKGYDAVHSNLAGADEYIVYNRTKLKVKR